MGACLAPRLVSAHACAQRSPSWTHAARRIPRRNTLTKATPCPFVRPAAAVLFLIVSVSVLSGGAAFGQNPSENAAKSTPTQGEPPENPFPQAIPVPEGILDGGSGWLNTANPISMKELRGKIVLLDFWTYCCINCMHVLPDLEYLEKKYDRQLVVIGVHSAKFDNEKVSQNIRDAILRYEIHHPVVNDSEMLIWRKFGTRAWPTLALVDPEGRYIGSQSGEGNRELFDQVIGKLVEYHRWKGTLDENPLVFGLESDKTTPTPLRFPGKVFADSGSQQVFISDTNHNRIVIATMAGELQAVIGSGAIGRRDGSFQEASFDHPQGLCLVGDLLYVADTENHLLRVADLKSGTVRTLAGTGEQGRPGSDTTGPLLSTPLNSPWSVTHVGGILYVAMAGPHQIWSHVLGSDRIDVFAGSGREDVINGSAADSAFAQPSELVADSAGTCLYVVDSEGSAIRRVSIGENGQVTTLAGTSELPRGQSLFAFGDVDAAGAEARFQHPLGVALDTGHLYVADSYNHKIRSVDIGSGKVETWLGTGQPGKSLQPPQLSEPGGLSIADGKLFIADTNNHRICIADLKTRELSELTVEGLTAPAPPRSAGIPDEPGAFEMPVQQLKQATQVRVSVTLAIPDGHKRNDLAPVTWEIFADSGQTVVPTDSLASREEASISDHVATFLLPLTGAAGETTLLLRMSYGFCADDGKLCRLATAAWRIPVVVSNDGPTEELQITFPSPKILSP